MAGRASSSSLHSVAFEHRQGTRPGPLEHATDSESDQRRRASLFITGASLGQTTDTLRDAAQKAVQTNPR